MKQRLNIKPCVLGKNIVHGIQNTKINVLENHRIEQTNERAY